VPQSSSHIGQYGNVCCVSPETLQNLRGFPQDFYVNSVGEYSDTRHSPSCLILSSSSYFIRHYEAHLLKITENPHKQRKTDVTFTGLHMLLRVSAEDDLPWISLETFVYIIYI
jgi:hypothetical protein